eukprot:CAMPEP_0170111028 /NCGR_PEP_ID=MMETSP0020_2-20130122/8228_1 /TAXON_ID=98059 /ORGANISM="Dinobryon sp., Strain UTEXLB2267" /LENGTH=695 /DNA_ID=CAMNT_0010336473 /DNA_START=18 /DNA_END=2106 /DNA_ORIENTATION=+
MTDNIIDLLNSIAKQDGYSREEEIREDRSIDDASLSAADNDNEIDDAASQARQPTMQSIPPPSLLPTDHVDPLGAGVDLLEAEDAAIVPHETDLQHNETISGVTVPQPTSAWVRRSVRNPREPNIALTVLKKPTTACQEAHLLPQLLNEKVTLTKGQKLAVGKDIRSQLVRRSQWHDTQYAFKMSVKAAMKDRPEEARPVIMAEIQQMVDKGVWHGVHMRDLTKQERKAIIRSMFLKDKYFASGEFEKFKADWSQQDKELYENLAAPTVATSHVFTVAGIAAKEKRLVVTVDVLGAYLNADMSASNIKVNMRLDKVMTKILLSIDPAFAEFVREDGSSVVQLDKALYGCIEAAHLWYNMLRKILERYGFIANEVEPCVFNRTNKDTGVQLTIALHVDDLLVTCACRKDLDRFLASGCCSNGEVSVTMEKCVEDVIRESGVELKRNTPATAELFETRDAATASVAEAKWFHTYVAKMLYIAKRVRPECLTAVSFLTTRVNCCDVDDLAKLRRLLGYLLATRERGITIRLGDKVRVAVYIDAAYGVHTNSGRSHGGVCTVVGEAGPVDAKSSKQHNVTKSSTEAELVALSDYAGRGMHMRNFLMSQGYAVGPVTIYQDNKSCMSMIERGRPTSDRSRHINIRHFWLNENIREGEVIVVHLGTEKMFANILTKPVQGRQFIAERRGLTNWNDDEEKMI